MEESGLFGHPISLRKERFMSDILLEAKGVTKTFPGVKALDRVNLTIKQGEVHGLIGENGAGKSTIIKVLAGVHVPDEGQISFVGQEYKNDSISQALQRGISVIYQELCLVPHMKVYENIMLGFENGAGGMYSKAETRERAKEIISMLDLELPLDEEVYKLDIAVQQMVEIAKAFSRNSKLIIMDEPTSSLSDKEVKLLYRIIRNLKDKGISTLFVSHKLEEVMEICDRVTVFRDGQSIVTKDIHEITREQMVYDMVGREITNYYTLTHVPKDEVVLSVKNLYKEGYIDDVSFELRKGEVLGVTGLIGAGRTEMALALFGLLQPERGEIIFEGEKKTIKSPAQAIDMGIVMVPENRKEQGIIPQMGVGYNISMAVLRRFIKLMRVDGKKENNIIEEYMKALKVKASTYRQHIVNLSGGNQQKAIIARWLATNPKVLILDEPTKGIDIGAKTEIYSIIDELAKQGVAIILISSELPEVINTSDRILVMKNHRIAGVLNDKAEFVQEDIMNYCLGGGER